MIMISQAEHCFQFLASHATAGLGGRAGPGSAKGMGGFMPPRVSLKGGMAGFMPPRVSLKIAASQKGLSKKASASTLDNLDEEEAKTSAEFPPLPPSSLMLEQTIPPHPSSSAVVLKDANTGVTCMFHHNQSDVHSHTHVCALTHTQPAFYQYPRLG